MDLHVELSDITSECTPPPTNTFIQPDLGRTNRTGTRGQSHTSLHAVSSKVKKKNKKKKKERKNGDKKHAEKNTDLLSVTTLTTGIMGVSGCFHCRSLEESFSSALR